METVTIRELRQNWPAVEQRLAAGGEIAVTRDGKPVATLTPHRAAASRPARKPFRAADHRRWLQSVWGDEKPALASEQLIAQSRGEREFASRSR
jgi:antitoxin (DNA-binding transcriptional repressor) of toxin-antitoxin stability system